jgi:hypothetical protein
MILQGLKRAPFNSTMMGALRGAADYYGLGVSDGWLYGASGHAFVINIHRELCPSGPYCYDRGPIYDLLRNVGLDVTCLGFHHEGSPPDAREEAERLLRNALDRGAPCFLVNMEFQLITGYDDTGFLTAQPWEGHDFPPAHLTFGSWSELGDGIHMDFHIVDRCAPASPSEAAVAAIRYGIGVWHTPPASPETAYAMGADAYRVWADAVRAGHGSSHGNWWNATVWAECRARAADFLREAAPVLLSPSTAEVAAAEYAEVAVLLERCGDKEMPADDKVGALDRAAEIEGAAVARLEAMLAG